MVAALLMSVSKGLEEEEEDVGGAEGAVASEQKGVAKGGWKGHRGHFLKRTPSDAIITHPGWPPNQMPSLYHYGGSDGGKSIALK
jgi:hypothetical protein